MLDNSGEQLLCRSASLEVYVLLSFPLTLTTTLYHAKRHFVKNLVQGATIIYADGFAIYGLIELAPATGDQVIHLARETYATIQ
jgi:hypothetical protein